MAQEVVSFYDGRIIFHDISYRLKILLFIPVETWNSNSQDLTQDVSSSKSFFSRQARAEQWLTNGCITLWTHQLINDIMYDCYG